MRDIHPLWAYIAISLLSLLVAYITFGILDSTGFIDDERIQLGGAAAGFIVIFMVVSRRYSSEMEKIRRERREMLEAEEKKRREMLELGEKGIKPRVTLTFKKNGKKIDNVQLNRSKCFYQIKRYEGEKVVGGEKDIVEVMNDHGEGGGYYIKLPIYMTNDMRIDLILTQIDGNKWEGTLDPEEYIVGAEPCQ